MRSLISVRDLTQEEVLSLYESYLWFKKGVLEKLKGRVCLLFLEPSTRTRLSFEVACDNLGLLRSTITQKDSSLMKGESFKDTLITLRELGFDGVIFRLPFVLYPYEELLDLGISLINGGDGTHEHPTQGLIDLFVALDRFKDLKGKRVLYVGDVKYSRVFRSGSYLFKMFGAMVGICSPPELSLQEHDCVDEIFYKVDEALPWAHLVIYLRLQRERYKDLVIEEESYFKHFGLTKERYEKIKGFFMHPGPVIRGIDVEPSLVYSEKSLILEQVRAGVFVREAVLTYAFDMLK